MAWSEMEYMSCSYQVEEQGDDGKYRKVAGGFRSLSEAREEMFSMVNYAKSNQMRIGNTRVVKVTRTVEVMR